MLLTAMKVNEILEYEALMFVMFALLQVDGKYANMELLIVCEFLEVFLYDISNLPPEREVEFFL